MSKMLIAALAAATIAAPALARDKDPVFVETKSMKDKPVVNLDAAKGYVLLRTDQATPLYLMKVPSPEDQVTYDALRQKALAEAYSKYAKKLASYEREVRAAAKGVPMTMKKPVEPTQDNFEFTPFGLMAAVAIGPLDRFAKAKGGASTYLQELTPGEYRLYGPLAIANGAAPAGMCFCMGSIKFRVDAGEVVDMGVILSKQSVVAKAPKGDSSMPVLFDIPDYLGPAPASMALDSRLAAFKVRRAEYRPVGKLPNYFGVTVGRVPEMAGVMRYERDRIVDLTASK